MNALGLAAGALMGGGAALALLTLLPARRDLAADLAALIERPAPAPTVAPAGGEGRLVVRLGRAGAPLLAKLGLPRTRTRRSLALLERPAGDHLAEQATLTAAGAALAPLLALLAGATSGVLLVVMAAIGAAWGFWLVDRQAHRAAAARRGQMRAVLSSYLDLVVLAVDGGAGIDQALTDAAEACTGWPGQRLAAALRTAHLTRTSAWDALARLGADTGIDELTDLAATAHLAGVEGARVRASLSARAASLRTRLLAEAEAAANRATEKLSMPMFLLAAGFLVLLTYPAMSGLMLTP